jgi:peptide chain release factor 2
MIEVSSIKQRIKDCSDKIQDFWTFFEIDSKNARLSAVNQELADSTIWQNPQKAQELGRERAQLENVVHKIQNLNKAVEDLQELISIIDDENSLTEITKEVNKLQAELDKMEFERMFSNEMDPNNAYLDIQSGSGGTEAQDWADMLLRMYLRWGDRKAFKTELLEVSAGEVAGIKSATVKFSGDYAYGWLRTESGVHRLVRKSPFDSGHRRHTSFASVFVYPEIDETIEVEINPADLRIDTYRASGAGGQHVNRTDSAVRITHLPTNTVVQCQNGRSQHQNKATAMNQLRARLYEIELRKRHEKQKALEDTKTDIGWGNQIRSYVLDQSRITDLRTRVEVGNTQAVLDGDLDQFIIQSLKEGV